MRARYLLSFALLSTLPIHLPRTHGPEVLKPLNGVLIPDIKGPVEHIAADVKGGRLFVAATGNNSIEIFDAKTLQHLDAINDLSQPQDLVYSAETGNLIVANGADGSVRTYDGKTLKLLDSKLMGGDADYIRLTPGGKSVVVGWGVGSLAIIDLQSGKRTNIQLKSHPESFQLDSIGNHIFVNLPGVGEISVIDRRSQTVVQSFPLRQRDNVPMALDEGNRRIFVVSQRPPRLVVVNMDDGAIMAQLPTVADAEDLFYDKTHKRVYVVGGEGLVAAYKQKGPDEYAALGRTDTVAEGRTGLFVPEWSRLYVVAKSRPPAFPAELLSFAVLEDQQ